MGDSTPAMPASQSAADISLKYPDFERPMAWLCRMSSPPYLRVARSTACTRSSATVTSQWTYSAESPRAVSAATKAWPASSAMSATRTVAPSDASFSATAEPIPATGGSAVKAYAAGHDRDLSVKSCHHGLLALRDSPSVSGGSPQPERRRGGRKSTFHLR